MMTCSYCTKQHIPGNNGDGLSPCCNAPMLDECLVFAAHDLLAAITKLVEVTRALRLDRNAYGVVDAISDAEAAIAKSEGR